MTRLRQPEGEVINFISPDVVTDLCHNRVVLFSLDFFYFFRWNVFVDSSSVSGRKCIINYHCFMEHAIGCW